MMEPVWLKRQLPIGMEQLTNAFEGARLALAAVGGSEAAVATSAIQKDACLDLIRRNGAQLSSDDRADLARRAASVGWQPPDLTVVCQASAEENEELD